MAKPDKLNIIWAKNGASVDPGDSKFELGWEAEIPPYQYFNYVLNKHSAMLDHINTHGIPEWDSLTTYTLGTRVLYNGVVYKSKITNNTGNTPDSSVTWAVSGERVEEYDFIVDSDQALSEMFTITDTYQNILIRKGTWTLPNSTFNLPEGTTITGESGAILAGSPQNTIFKGTSTTRNTYKIKNLKFTLTNSNLIDENEIVALLVDNIDSVDVVIDADFISSTSNNNIFNSCNRITNTNVTISAITTDPSVDITGFYNCDYLSNINILYDGSSFERVVGFYYCANCTNIFIESHGAMTQFYGFRESESISNITIELDSTLTGMYGLYNTSRVTNMLLELNPDHQDTNLIYGCVEGRYITSSEISILGKPGSSVRGMSGVEAVSACYVTAGSVGTSTVAYYSCAHVSASYGYGATAAFENGIFIYGCTASGGGYINTSGVSSNNLL